MTVYLVLNLIRRMLRGSADLGRVAGEELVVSLMGMGMNAVLVLSRFVSPSVAFVSTFWYNMMKVPSSVERTVKYSLDHHPHSTTSLLCDFDLELKIFIWHLTAVIPTYSSEKFSWGRGMERRNFSLPL